MALVGQIEAPVSQSEVSATVGGTDRSGISAIVGGALGNTVVRTPFLIPRRIQTFNIRIHLSESA